jgi:MFS family permease
LAALTAVGNFAINMVLGILVLYATDAHGLGVTEAEYGLLLVAMAVGGVAGGFIAPWVAGRLGSRTTMIAGLAAEGAAWAVLGTTGNPFVAGAALALGFVGVTLVSVVVMTARQKQAPPELLGKVISAFRVFGNGPAPLGALAGGALATAVGLRAPIFVAAAITLLAVILVIRVHVNNGR